MSMTNRGMRLYQDNARWPTAHVTTNLINRFGWDIVTHPFYRIDMAPQREPSQWREAVAAVTDHW